MEHNMPSLVNDEPLKKIVNSQDVQLLEQPMVLFHPTRILVMKALLNFISIDFRDLQNNYNLSAGNLASNLKMLIDEKYIKKHKQFIENRPRTTIEITDKGRTEFVKFKECLKEVLQDANE